MKKLIEDSRQQLISKSKSGKNYAPSNQHKGKNRFARRVHSSVMSSVKEYNDIDMNRLFQEGMLSVKIPVLGETDKYLVKLYFGGFLDEIQKEVQNRNKFDFGAVLRVLTRMLNQSKDVYIGCTCKDFKFRFGHLALVHDISSITDNEWRDKGDGLVVTRAPEITNPNDDLGPCCKHIALVLSNQMWLMKVAAVVNNYVNYMKSHYKTAYAEIIYPSIYGKEYEDELVVAKSDKDTELGTDTRLIDISNQYGADRGKFKTVTNKPNQEQEQEQEEL